jgi:hypothetical protein
MHCDVTVLGGMLRSTRSVPDKYWSKYDCTLFPGTRWRYKFYFWKYYVVTHFRILCSTYITFVSPPFLLALFKQKYYLVSSTNIKVFGIIIYLTKHCNIIIILFLYSASGKIKIRTFSFTLSLPYLFIIYIYIEYVVFHYCDNFSINIPYRY